MLNKYDIMDRIVYTLGTIGHIMVYLGMIAGIILFWYLLFKML